MKKWEIKISNQACTRLRSGVRNSCSAIFALFLCFSLSATVPNCGGGSNSGGSGGNRGGRDPVHIISGATLFQSRDISIPGKGFGLVFERTYVSIVPFTGILGNKWAHNYDYSASLSLAPPNKRPISTGGSKASDLYDEVVIHVTIASPNSGQVNFKISRPFLWSPQTSSPTISEIVNLVPVGTILQVSRENSFIGFQQISDKTTLGSNSLGNDHSQLFRNADNTWTWRKKDGTKFLFEAFSGSLDKRQPTSGDKSWRRSASAKLLNIEDPNGNKVILTYDSQNRIADVTDPSGRKLTFTYFSDRVEIADPANRVWKYFVTSGNLTRVEDPAGNARTYEYDSNSNLIRAVNVLGGITTFTYDDKGRQISETDPTGTTLNIFYSTAPSPYEFLHPSTSTAKKIYNTTKIVWPNGFTEIYKYDPATGEIVSIIDPSGLETLRFYDADGNIVQLMARKNGQTLKTMHYIYDNFGNLVKFIDPMNKEWKFEYENTFNKMTSRTDPLGNKFSFEYDAKGNVLKTIAPDGMTLRTYTYDAFGSLITDKDGNNNTTTYERNTFGYVTKGIDPLLNQSLYAYDSAGNVTSFTDALGQVTLYEYNVFNQVTKITNALGKITLFAYDAAGNRTSITDSLGRVTQYTNDTLGRLLQVKDPANNINQFEYDATGNLIKVIDPRGNSTHFEYSKAVNSTIREDKFSHEYSLRHLLTKLTDPLGNITQYDYDDFGNLLKITKPNGATIDFTYDPNDNPLTKTLAGGEITTYSYDALSRTTQISNLNSDRSLSYDGLNSIISDSQTVSGVFLGALNYSYDAVGNKVSMVDPQGGQTTYSYDARNKLVSITNPLNKVTQFAYNAVGNRTGANFANGTVADYSYDAIYHVTAINHKLGTTDIASYSYSYDDVGNRTSMIDLDGTHNYAYDVKNQIISATHPQPFNPQESFTYDSAANRSSSHLSSTYLYDAANRLTEDSNFNYSYDANGNIVQKTRKTDQSPKVFKYFYNAENQMTRYEEYAALTDTAPAKVATYKYDGVGRRVEKNVDGTITRFFYDGDNILQELDGNNNTIAKYTLGSGVDESIIVDRSGQTFFYHADALGSIVKITDSSGSVVNSYAYDSFGRIVSETENVSNSIKYTGRESDSESGLYYYRARYYMPNVGRFMTIDPLLRDNNVVPIRNSHIDLQPYVYVKNNPIIYIDPIGLAWIGVRPINGLGWTFPFLYHSQIFFNQPILFNGQMVSNIGYGPNGFVTNDDPNLYTFTYGSFDDTTMANAVYTTPPSKYTYCAYNCRNWVGNVVRQYGNLIGGGGGGPKP